MEQPETWTITEVAEYLGYAGKSASGSARKQLSRWRIAPLGRQPGRGGLSIYDASAVRKAQAARPGQGARTDRPTPSR